MANLNLNRILPISIAYAQAQGRAGNFGTLLILGDSPIIDGSTRLKFYDNSEGIVADFGATSREAQAAIAYFAQVPSPRGAYVGRWQNVVQAARLATFWPTSGTDPVWAQLKAAGTGALTLDVNGAAVTIANINLAAVTSIQTLFTAIDTAAKAVTGAPVAVGFSAAAGLISFNPVPPTTGKPSISFARAPATGTDFSTLLRATAAQGATLSLYMDGAETILDAVVACRAAAGDWYGLSLVPTKAYTEDDMLAVADLVESWKSIAPGMFFLQSNSAGLPSASTTDIGSRVKAKALDKTQVIYASADQNLGSRAAGYMFSTDFSAVDSVRSLGNKVLTGAIPDQLQQGQDTTLEGKHVNYCATWGATGNFSIYRTGRMGSGKWADEVHALDWFQTAIQIAVMNVFVSARTKVPQTRSGQVRVETAIQKVCAQAVRCGLLAPGVWDQPGFGALSQGDTLPNGYYIWSEPLASQAVADRQARLLPPVHIAACGAGSAQGMLTSVVFQP